MSMARNLAGVGCKAAVWLHTARVGWVLEQAALRGQVGKLGAPSTDKLNKVAEVYTEKLVRPV